MVNWITFEEYIQIESHQSIINSFSGEYSFLSNFYPSPIKFEGVIYPTVEHAYQSAKTNIPEEKEMFKTVPTPGKAKKLSKRITLRSDWDDIKIYVMDELLRKKFNNPELRNKLIQTYDNELIEGNTWYDTFWGVCNGVGENNLGKLLMQIRKEAQHGQED